MNRRDVLTMAVTAAVPVLPEVTLPRTADERLTEAVRNWMAADANLANLTRNYESARQLIWTGMAQQVPARALKSMVEARQQARDEMESARRTLADAETRMATAARLANEIHGGARDRG